MRNRYKNGKDVLSNNLLEELRGKGLSGFYIYIPPKNIAVEKNRMCILAGEMKFNEGLKIDQISDKLHIGVRQTYYLLALFKKRYPGKCV